MTRMNGAICVIGAGPTGTCLLERICANAPEVIGWQQLDVHVVDPHPPGGGRVWRRDQPDLLWMNSGSVDPSFLGFFSYIASGPPGPRLEELLALARAGIVTFTGADAWVVSHQESGTWRTGSLSAPRGSPDPDSTRRSSDSPTPWHARCWGKQSHARPRPSPDRWRSHR